MMRLVGWFMAAVGAVITLWAGSIALTGSGATIYGYHATYAGLVGVSLLTAGLLTVSQK